MKWFTPKFKSLLVLACLLGQAIAGKYPDNQPCALATPTGTGDYCLTASLHSAGVGNKPQCTAQDVKISIDSPNAISCHAGDTVTLTPNITVHCNSASDRYDLGLYLASDGGDAYTGACTKSAFTPCAGTGSAANDPLCYYNADGDCCGDLQGKSTVTVLPGQISAVCQANAGSNNLAIGVCISWRVPGQDINCQSITDVGPGNPAKCWCGEVEVTGCTVIPPPVEAPAPAPYPAPAPPVAAPAPTPYPAPAPAPVEAPAPAPYPAPAPAPAPVEAPAPAPYPAPAPPVAAPAPTPYPAPPVAAPAPSPYPSN
jgi:hypothetical protein